MDILIADDDEAIRHLFLRGIGIDERDVETSEAAQRRQRDWRNMPIALFFWT